MSGNSRDVGCCVVYRWKLRQGLEPQFIDAWTRGTKLILQKRGALGSRLHQADDGTWYAYAQWPSRAAWEAHRAAASVDAEVARLMREAEEMAYPAVCLQPVADFLAGSSGGALTLGSAAPPADRSLYEAHLPVADTEVSKDFYVGVVGLQFAHRDMTRDIVFLWAGRDRGSMLGLWGPETIYGKDPHRCHIAFAMSLPELLQAAERVSSAGIETQNFAGEHTIEPSVIGWMPSAQIYFRDPDEHSVEFITLLDDIPDPAFVGSLSAWRSAAAAVKAHTA